MDLRKKLNFFFDKRANNQNQKSKLEIKTLRVKPEISSNFKLKGKIKKKNQIHKVIQNKNKNQENKDQT